MKDTLVENERIFKLDAFLATNTEWSGYGLRELKTIIAIYSSINPEWKELKPMVFTAKELNEIIGLNTRLGYNEMFKIFTNIKKNVQECIYKPSENNSDNLMPLKMLNYSLVGSCEAVINQKEEDDYLVSVQRVAISFDEHIKEHLLFAKNVVKDKNGKAISGVKQHFTIKERNLLEFNDAKALRLFLTLFMYNNVAVNMRFEDLCKKIGVKTQVANKQTLLRSAMADGPRVDKLRKKFYDFKSRTLNKMVDEINRCTNMGLTYTDKIYKKKDGSTDIIIKFNIPKYRDNLLYSIDEQAVESAIEENKNSKLDIQDSHKESCLDDSSVDAVKISTSDVVAIEDKSSDSDALFWSDNSEIDWASTFNQIDVSANNLNEDDLAHIDNLYKIYSMKSEITKKDIEQIFVDNNKDPKLVNKILSNRLSSK